MKKDKAIMLIAALYLRSAAQKEYDAALAQKNSARAAFDDVLKKQFMPNDEVFFIKGGGEIQSGYVLEVGKSGNILLTMPAGHTSWVRISNILDALDAMEGQTR